jgi:hypothetical protein
VAYAAAGVALAVLAAVVVLHRVSAPRPVAPTSLPIPAPGVTSGGVAYARLAVAYLDTSRHTSVTVGIPGGDTPVAVFASCRLAEPGGRAESAVALSTTAGYATAGGMFGCANTISHAAQVARSALPGNGTELTFRVMDSYADTDAGAPAAWAFAIYSVTVPDQQAPPPGPAASITLAGSPATEPGSYALVRAYSGFWPAQRTVRITIPAGAPSVISFWCPAPLAGQEISLPGNEDSDHVNATTITCAAADHATATSTATAASTARLGTQRPAAADPPTETAFTLTLDPTDQSLAGQWVIAVYQR